MYKKKSNRKAEEVTWKQSIIASGICLGFFLLAFLFNGGLNDLIESKVFDELIRIWNQLIHGGIQVLKGIGIVIILSFVGFMVKYEGDHDTWKRSGQAMDFDTWRKKRKGK